MTKASGWSEQALAYRFEDPGLLDRALTHRSAGGRHNERLEFLGDALLGMVVAEALFQTLPDADEGYLSRLRAHLVRRETLAELAREVSLGERLQLGSGELKSGGHRRASILANGIEAILGAVYLDGGYEAARTLTLRLLGKRLAALPTHDQLKDPKTRLQEYLQGRGQELPDYEIESVTGLDHKQRFTAACVLQKQALRTVGEGGSRRKAEQLAAAAMIALLETGDG